MSKKGFETSTRGYQPPYAFDAQSEPPQNEEEAAQLLRAAANAARENVLETHFGPILTRHLACTTEQPYGPGRCEFHFGRTRR